MKYLQGVTLLYWSANHIALQVTKTSIAYENGHFELEVDEEANPIRVEKFRAFSHDSEFQESCSREYIPTRIKEVLNSFFDCKRKKNPAVITDYWEDCSLYIREDQIDALKSLYELMIHFYAFDDDEEFERGEDDEEHINALSKALKIKTPAENQADALDNAKKYPLLAPLLNQLRENKTALQKKYIILNFVDSLKTEKGLMINLSYGLDDDSRYGKLPLMEWTLPLGNSLSQQDDNHEYLDNLNLFGLHELGINKGIKRFSDPKSLVNSNEKETYYKFYSRYHNCSGYSRFLLEQGGITVFCSTNKLERYGITDPAKYNDFMRQASKAITELNDKARDLMKRAQIKPEPLEACDINFLEEFKKGELNYALLPQNIRSLLDEYNKEQVDISYEHKISILMNIIKNMHKHPIINPIVIDALQKEIRRNYEIDFDAQFSHNNHFQLQALGAIAGISIGALVVGMVAIAFPQIIPVYLAVTLIITAATAASLSMGFFARKSEVQRPKKVSLVQEKGSSSSEEELCDEPLSDEKHLASTPLTYINGSFG